MPLHNATALPTLSSLPIDPLHYSFTNETVMAGTNIRKRVTRYRSLIFGGCNALTEEKLHEHKEKATDKKVAENKSKPCILVLTAKGGTAVHKLISIVEVLKSSVDVNGRQQQSQEVVNETKLFQYNILGSEIMTMIPARTTDDKNKQKDEEEEDYFEEPHKVRNIPCLMVLLCTQSIDGLKDAYGEQVITA